MYSKKILLNFVSKSDNQATIHIISFLKKENIREQNTCTLKKTTVSCPCHPR
jgi:hypothetical protein